MGLNREILKSSEESEEIETGGQRLAEETEKNQELGRILTRIDFGLLKNLLRHIAARSGMNAETMNFVENTRIAHSAPEIGQYDPARNVIGISYEASKRRAERFDFDLELVILETVIHEEIHATSKIECSGPELQPPFIEKVKVGFSRYTKETPKEGYGTRTYNLFRLFNEGVTEKLARAVFSEYVRKGTLYQNRRKAVKTIEDGWYEYADEFAYGTAMEFVNALIAKISKETGVRSNLVWQAIVRGMYEGEEFQNEELRSLFTETISPSFLDKLASANSDLKMSDLMSELKKTGGTHPPLKKKLLKWLKGHGEKY